MRSAAAAAGRAAAWRRRAAHARAVLALWLLSSTLASALAAGTTPSAPLVRSGTAFFVSSAGYLLTSAHVVAACRRISLWQPQRPPQDAKLVALDAARDLALLSTSGARAAAALLPRRPALPTGSSVTVIGYGLVPDNPEAAVLTEGTVVGMAAVPSGRRVLVIEASLREGNSGGPVLDEAGILRGMIIGQFVARPDESVAVPAGDIKRFLAAHGIAFRSAAAAAGGADAELRRIAALVQCAKEDGG